VGIAQPKDDDDIDIDEADDKESSSHTQVSEDCKIQCCIYQEESA
jgi:hypothetical protein